MDFNSIEDIRKLEAEIVEPGIILAVRYRHLDVYIYATCEVTWSGHRFDEWNRMNFQERSAHLVDPDYRRCAELYRSWRDQPTDEVLHLRYRVMHRDGTGYQWLNCYFKKVKVAGQDCIMEISHPDLALDMTAVLRLRAKLVRLGLRTGGGGVVPEGGADR